MPFRFLRIFNHFASKIASRKVRIFRRKSYPSQAFPAEVSPPLASPAKASRAPPDREEPPLRELLADGRTVYRGRWAALAENTSLESLWRAGGDNSESDDEEYKWNSEPDKE